MTIQHDSIFDELQHEAATRNSSEFGSLERAVQILEASIRAVVIWYTNNLSINRHEL